MKLVYKISQLPVEIGDIVRMHGDAMKVTFFREPHKPSSEGKVSVALGEAWSREYFVSVIGAEWIEREDRIETE